MRRVLIAAALAAVLAGCGGSEEEQAPAATADERAIAATLQRYAEAVRARDARTICTELLAPDVIEQVATAGGECERDLIAERIAEGGPGYRLTVRSIEVAGDRATARTIAVERDGPRSVAQPLVRVSGGWRLSP
jgi:ketosteroid isomerase-like protein